GPQRIPGGRSGEARRAGPGRKASGGEGAARRVWGDKALGDSGRAVRRAYGEGGCDRMTGRAHAVLSASGAHRWNECPPSARLEEQFPDESSPYAEEGTIAHALAEVRLRQALGAKVRISSKVTKSEHYNPAMEEHIAGYVTLVMERI